MTKQQIATELTRMAKVQISDITRTVKDCQKGYRPERGGGTSPVA